MATTSLVGMVATQPGWLHQLHVDVIAFGIIAGVFCILLLLKKKKIVSKVIWKFLFWFCLFTFLFYSINISDPPGSKQCPFFNGVCFGIKLLPDSILPPILFLPSGVLNYFR
jgi:hypothetical protein